MASPFSAIDLSKLPAPDVVESLSVEAIVEEITQNYIASNPDFTAQVESDRSRMLKS